MKKENKKVRVYFNGTRQKDIYLHKRKYQIAFLKLKRFIKRLLVVCIVIGIIWSVYQLGGIFNQKEVVTQIKVETKSPILDKIAKCESPTGHFAKNGQVVLRGNKNKTVDVGKYQINTYFWGAKASELGYDLTIEKDNEAMAKYIYQNFGTEAWSASKECWNK